MKPNIFLIIIQILCLLSLIVAFYLYIKGIIPFWLEMAWIGIVTIISIIDIKDN